MYKYKNKCYTVVNESAQMKDPTTREWMEAVVYSSEETGQVYVREAKDFRDKFEEVTEEPKEDPVEALRKAILTNKKELWKRDRRYLSVPYVWWISDYADLGFVVEVGVMANLRTLNPTKKSLIKYAPTLLTLAQNILALPEMPNDLRVTIRFFIKAQSGKQVGHLNVVLAKGQPIFLALDQE